jgi:L-fucose isomerase-like protein
MMAESPRGTIIMKKVTLGVIVGNRGFFPSHLCETGRAEVLRILEAEGIGVVALSPRSTPYGSIESHADASACADLFRKNRETIDGLLVTLPNFGDERAVANAIRGAGLDVPVLVHAFADDAKRMSVRYRRDSFCGKLSVCNNLRQYRIPFSLTALHTVDPASDAFREDLRWFAAVCRVVRTLRGARLGCIGARPAAFNTVRFSEKLLEGAGISVETLDLSEVIGRARKLGDRAPEVRRKLEAIRRYTAVKGVPGAGLLRMAKLGAVIDGWMRDNDLAGSAIQCWTSMEEFYGVVPCTLMSMMSNALVPSACETDIAGLVGMMALQAASGRPSALLDWNNNYGEDPDKAVVFHCSNLPKAFFADHRMDYQAIIAGSVGRENTYGTIVGRIPPGRFTYCRISTDDARGAVVGYLGEGEFTDDKLDTFGGYGVAHIPRLQDLLAYACENGFEHHVAANRSEVAQAVHEALSKYLGWPMYHHDA